VTTKLQLLRVIMCLGLTARMLQLPDRVTQGFGWLDPPALVHALGSDTTFEVKELFINALLESMKAAVADAWHLEAANQGRQRRHQPARPHPPSFWMVGELAGHQVSICEDGMAEDGDYFALRRCEFVTLQRQIELLQDGDWTS
jgi:hypothetical protein